MKKTAMITGASRGIGKAIARYFADRNYNLILIARNNYALIAVKKELENTNSELMVACHAMDLSCYEQAYKRLTEIVKNSGYIDVLFNNAGMGCTGTLDLDVSQFSKMVDLNIKGLFVVAKAVGLKMKEQKQGYIINVASVSGKSASPYLT